MKILQIGHDKLFSKYLTTVKVGVVHSKTHVSLFVTYMGTNFSLLKIVTHTI